MSFFVSLLTGYKKYEIKKINNNKKLEKQNKKMVEMLKRNNISKINLTSIGNSIATGYSAIDTIKPLLKRNESLKKQLEKDGINYNCYSFARPQNNNDEHLLNWLIKNIKLSEVNRIVRLDFGKNINAMDSSCITDEEIEIHYPLNPKNDIGFKDLIMEGNDNEANIIVYNGGTGSFLDDVTRGRKRNLLSGFFRDFKSMDTILKIIYLKHPHTQVYICGLPTLTKLNLTAGLNKKIKRICDFYPNCTYVEPSSHNFFYLKNGLVKYDFHYNCNEYLNLNEHIINSIYNNYERNKCLIDFDIETKKINNYCQYEKPDARKDKTIMLDPMLKVINKYNEIMDKKMLKTIKNYYKRRYTSNFYLTPRNEVLTFINNQIETSK